MSKKLKSLIRESVFEDFKDSGKLSQSFSLRVGVLHKGKEVFNELYGKNFVYYDLASLTKALFTATYFYRHPGLLKSKVSSVLPWLYMSNIRVKDLLNHSSGLDRYKELYRTLKDLPVDEKNFELKRILRSEALKVKSGKKHKPMYSDLGFLVLGLFIEELEGMSLDLVFKEQNKIKGFHYNVENKPLFKRSLYAPTENCLWRKKKLQGEVFDDNTFALNGVAPQAGLFGSMEDVLDYGKDLRKMYAKSPEYFKRVNSDWANGFMVPSGVETTAGALFSKKSIGHLGYTGTSFWYDPTKDLFVAILSNRTFPERQNNYFNRYRPLIQNLVYKEFIG